MKKFSLLFALIALLFSASAASACGLSEKTAAGYENAEITHAYQHWIQGDKSPIPFMFIDVRTPEEYAEGHIEGAKLIPLQELENHINEVPKDRQVYVYCHSGRRSAKAAGILAAAGFTNIENVLGGIVAWQEHGYPTAK